MSTGGATGPAGPLRYPAFLGALGARSTSQAGSWIQTVAVGWLAFHLTHQAVAVGLIALLSLLPPVVLSEPGVVLDNRFGVRRVTMVLYALQVLPAGALAVAAAVGAAAIGGLADAVGIQWALVPGAVLLTGLGTYRLWRTRLYGVHSPDGQ